MKSKLIVSCQALEGEPLHSPFIMSKMALAAYEGGAGGIRANSVIDIQAIKQEVDLPIIGIIKRDFEGSDVFITPTLKEVDELVAEGVDIIAFDATLRERPDSKTIEEFIGTIKMKYPNQKFMADISTVEEAINAEKLGVDYVGTTLVGYTEYTKEHDPLEILEHVVKQVTIPVIAEGNINTPEKARKALELGASAVVVGSAVTRPKYITESFYKEMEKSFKRKEKGSLL
ncbi:N-acetylmannosamine-6-phosphate 2-epimerase [Halalkalibacter krulwichiae]|uniref:Putative N-acetylmannosamine-6-phosphate 2-epimerase n=1 Tax=Halalkalibacter krulwichiae TaxID=199441 RepID=A0A1X9M8U8_9BACI|nr:N-acetylmannosamine-6-phosphate 2-epimerase [Halalkalibacter krulwichiae]ARK29845.1 Putative N-acetylmannosamine-6-phosphate 2-epimerase [Halalkalibacter krulwichiae]